MSKSPPTSRKPTFRVYRPDSRFDAGVFTALFALVGELSAYRSHIKTLFASEFRVSYSGTVLGVMWNFILPLVPISVYILLVNLRVLPRMEGIAPAIYVGFNVTLWYLFTGLIRQPIDVVLASNASAMKTAIPLSASIASSFAELTFHTLVRLALVAVLVVAISQWPAQSGALMVVAVLAGGMFCFALGLSLSVLNAIYPDIQRVVGIALQYGIFLSGVIFPIASVPQLGWLEVANPLNVFIQAARDWTFAGALSQPAPFAAWSAAGVLLLLLSTRFFYVMEHRLRGLS
jgi:lipopolysaccharide transport system permease protein